MTDVTEAIGRLKRGAWAFAFATPIYRFTLGGAHSTALFAAPPDTWPGDSDNARALLDGVYRFNGQTIQAERPVWSPSSASEPWMAALHGFDWLRDLRAHGGESARRAGRMLIADWLDRCDEWDETIWRGDILGQRIVSWLAFYEFYAAGANEDFRIAVLDSLARQARHLSRIIPGEISGSALLVALKGLAYSGACLRGGQARLTQALKLLHKELPRQVAEDGVHAERNPAMQLSLLRHLVDLRAALLHAHEPVPEAIQSAINRMASALRLFRHGDGGLALFNGGDEAASLLADAVLAQADARGRAPTSAPRSGFERLALGRALVLADVGAPPPQGFDAHAHAGTLSFEMSVGRQRMIVNCGGHRGAGAWHQALRCTAAHSTVTIEDSNSSELLPSYAIGRRAQVTYERVDGADACLLDARHDGYAEPFGIVHRRRLYLADGGEDLRGEDTLTGPAGRRFAIRFHLHPDVQVSPIQNSRAALVRVPASSSGWRLRTSIGNLSVEESVYFGAGDHPRRSNQVVIAGETGDGGTLVKWALRREKKPA
jgi:uncharacterized heparinase superfamily protein